MTRTRRKQAPLPYIAPTGLRSWTAFLIAIAVLWHFAKGPLIGLMTLIFIFVICPWLLYRIALAIEYFLTGSRL
jgi:hypothetical protein